MTPTSKSSGYTMIELLVVATIIIVLTAIGLVSYRSVGYSARNGKREADIETVRQALVLYRTDNAAYPAVTGKSAANFASMITTIQSYISAAAITDPSNESPYQYTYQSDGATFSVCFTEEPDATEQCLTNP